MMNEYDNTRVLSNGAGCFIDGREFTFELWGDSEMRYLTFSFSLIGEEANKNEIFEYCKNQGLESFISKYPKYDILIDEANKICKFTFLVKE